MATRLFLLALIASISCIPAAWADGSVWYKDGDPLFTADEMPNPVYGVGFTPQIAGQTCPALDFNKALTLADVTEAALCQNPQTRETYANAKVQAAQLGIAKSAFLPVLTNNIGMNQNVASPESATRGREYNTLTNNLAASYLLYDFGNRNATLENARQLLNAVSATQSAIVQTLLLNTVKAYYQAQSDLAALDAAREAERFNQESFKAAEAKYKAGISTPADKLQAETAYAQAVLNRVSAEGTLNNDLGALAAIMGLNANMPIRLQPVANSPVNALEIERDIGQLIEYARVRRPDLLASEAQLSAAKATIEASRAAAKPTLSVGLSNTLQDGSSFAANNVSTLGLTVTVPIFAGYAPTYRIRAAEATADAREAQRDQLKLKISLDVWTAFQNLRTAHQTIEAAEVLVRSATQSAGMALGRYKAGVGNIIDTLNAQTALANANQQRIKAYLDRNIARAALAQSIGTLDSVMIQSLPDGTVAGTEINF